MRCGDVIRCLEQAFPPGLAEEWDNTGWMCGRPDQEISKICIAVDLTETVINEALRQQAELILTHHPLIFKPVSRVVTNETTGRLLYMLIQNDISCYSMHTNYDVCGMAAAAAARLGLENSEILEVSYEDQQTRAGIGRVGRLPRRMTLRDCAELVKNKFALDTVRVYGDGGRFIERAAISPGSGSGLLPSVFRAQAEVLITGDIKHDMGLEGLAGGLAMIDAGHFGLEKIFIPELTRFLARELTELSLCEGKEANPFYVI